MREWAQGQGGWAGAHPHRLSEQPEEMGTRRGEAPADRAGAAVDRFGM